MTPARRELDRLLREVESLLKGRERQLAALQAKHTRVCGWVREHGGDPVEIGNGTVEIGERVESDG